MKKISFGLVLGVVEVVFIFGLSALPAHADTHVSGEILRDTVWTATSSPYLLDSDVTVPDGVTLTVGAGVNISISPGVDSGDDAYDPAIYVSGGKLSIQGTARRRVSVDQISGIFVAGGSMENGSADIAYTDISGGTGLSFENSRGVVSTSTISGASIGVYTKDSVVSVQGSRITGNDIGVYVQPHKVFLLGQAAEPGISTFADRFATGGSGNAFEGDLAIAPDISASSSLVISGSSLAGNTSYAIKNLADFRVTAKNDWWGSTTGPALSGADSVYGPVDYSPWLLSEPVFDSGAATAASPCCSSVLFIPGLEGTRLYRPESRPLGLGSTINQLWEPNRNADVMKLFLGPQGSSTDPSIYSGGPIGKGLGFVDIYGGFMGFMDSLVKKGTMNEWRAFGYDWRKPISEVVAGSEKKATTSESLIQTVTDLASRSKTGKVTIVAHSNGGLVAKYLVKTLADMGQTALIDSVISVGVPYLGTPEAILGLLHGDGQDILGGWIASKANARTLGSNMSSAYSLLPSREFFQKIFSPTIALASTSVKGLDNGAYPASIDSFTSQQAFIADTAHVRKTPAATDTRSPIKGNLILMAAADIIHGVIDPFTWPDTIARWAITGWDVDTTKTVKYSSENHDAIRTKYGDGTVISASAAFDSDGQVVPLDLKVASTLDGSDIDHVNILEASSTKTAIGSILTAPSETSGSPYSDNPAKHNTKVIDELSKIPGVTVGDMDWNKLMAEEDSSRKELTISTHSPVELHIYDSHGNHTGIIPLPGPIQAQVDSGELEAGLYRFTENKIPDSSIDIQGDDTDPETYINVPDNGQKYTIVVQGLAAGSFRLDIERIRATSTVETVEWSGVPVTSLGTATTTVVSFGGFDAGAAKLASSTAPLLLDIDGNGSVDATTSPNAPVSADLFWNTLKKACVSVGHNSRASQDIGKQIDRVNILAKSGRLDPADRSDMLHDIDDLFRPAKRPR